MGRTKTHQLIPKVINGFLKFKTGYPKPLFVSYNVTSRCNMKCVFCEWWKHQIPELSTKKALNAIDAVCSLGIPFFDLSGGEPLLRQDLLILAKRVASHGCLVSMNTNGTLLTKNNVFDVANHFDTVVVSLDGPKEIHDKIRGVPGTYEKATKAIQLLRKKGVKTGVNSVATPWNIDILPEFIEELHCFTDFVQVQPMHPYPPSPKNVPSDQQVSKLIDYLLDLKHRDSSFIAIPTEFINGFRNFFAGNAPKICDAGELYIAINPEGKLLACPARSDLLLGDTLCDSVDSVLKTRNNEGWRKISSCRGCWLECTVGVSMILKNPLQEVQQLLRLWMQRKN
jgi:MoaA/NifB/PqqE/SkfB family radical SAM enzyme